MTETEQLAYATQILRTIWAIVFDTVMQDAEKIAHLRKVLNMNVTNRTQKEKP